MRRVLLDTDLAMGAPGSEIDDGFALALALSDPGLRVELVTTVNGNTDVETATGLTLNLLARLQRTDIPVVRGAAHSLDGWRHDPPAKPSSPYPGAAQAEPGYAAVRLVERVLAEPGELTIVAIGPLTNVALALCLDPAVATSVHEIVVMGGVFLEHTNTRWLPGEYNVWCDPIAAATVLASGAPLRFVGLDVTRRVRLTRQDAARLAASDREFASFAGERADEWITVKKQQNPADPREHTSCAMHDPLAVGVLIRPDIVGWRPAYVQVETSSAVTRGVMVADLLTSEHPPEANCEIAVSVDSQAFMDLFLERMLRL